MARQHISFPVPAALVFGSAELAIVQSEFYRFWDALRRSQMEKKGAKRAENWRRGRFYVRHRLAEWSAEHFPFWDEHQLSRHFQRLVAFGTVEREQDPGYHRDYWYTNNGKRFGELARARNQDPDAWDAMVRGLKQRRGDYNSHWIKQWRKAIDKHIAKTP